MSQMTVTDVGLESSRNARIGGFRISIKQFSVTEASGFTLDSARTSPVGTPVYRANVASVEDLDGSTVKVTCTLPAGYPTTGEWRIGEVNLWDENNKMFAYGYTTVFPKLQEYGLKFYVYVTLARLGDVINVTTSDVMSLPSTARVATLIHPNESHQNTIVVLDQNSHQEEINAGAGSTDSSPALAIRYGPASSMWGFIGHDRVYYGTVTSVIDGSSFEINPATHGFWLNEGEVVIVQIVEGPGAGESRKMQYSTASHRLVSVDDAFSTATTSSVLAIWRDNANALPLRHAGIPDYYVLNVGQNDFQYNLTPDPVGRLLPYLSEWDSTGASSYTVDSSMPLMAADEGYMHVALFYAGQLVPMTRYEYANRVVTLNPSFAAGKKFTMYAWQRDDTQGGECVLTTSSEAATNQDSISLPSIPDSKARVMIFWSDGTETRLVSPSLFSLNINYVMLQAGARHSTGTFYVIYYATTDNPQVMGRAQRNAMTLTDDDTFIDFSNDGWYQELRPEARNIVLYKWGFLIPPSEYTWNSSQLRMTLKNPGAGNYETYAFVGQLKGSGITGDAGTFTGENTGPRWEDPAGSDGAPNKLSATRRIYTTDSSGSYAVTSVPDIFHLVVFLNGTYVPSTDFLYDGMSIYPKSSWSSGQRLEIVCFSSVDDVGRKAAPVQTRLVATGGNTYTIHSGADANSLMVFVGNQYKPTNTYSYNATTGALSFSANVASGTQINAWSYADVSEAGYCTKLKADVLLIQSKTAYELRGVLPTKAHVIAAQSGAFLSYDQFTITGVNDRYSLVYGSTPSAIGQDLQVVEFSTFKPQTRLVLRSDLGEYLDRNKNLSDVLDKEAARANLGIGDAINGAMPDLSPYLQKADNLASVVDKAAARNNLGITGLLSDVWNAIDNSGGGSVTNNGIVFGNYMLQVGNNSAPAPNPRSRLATCTLTFPVPFTKLHHIGITIFGDTAHSRGGALPSWSIMNFTPGAAHSAVTVVFNLSDEHGSSDFYIIKPVKFVWLAIGEIGTSNLSGSSNSSGSSGTGSSSGSGSTGPGSSSGGGGGGGCVTLETVLEDYDQAADVLVNGTMTIYDRPGAYPRTGVVTYSVPKLLPCVLLVCENGVELECSTSAQIADVNAVTRSPMSLIGEIIPTQVDGLYEESRVTSVTYIGDKWIQHITAQNAWFLAGKKAGYYVWHHNMKAGPSDPENTNEQEIN